MDIIRLVAMGQLGGKNELFFAQSQPFLRSIAMLFNEKKVKNG